MLKVADYKNCSVFNEKVCKNKNIRANTKRNFDISFCGTVKSDSFVYQKPTLLYDKLTQQQAQEIVNPLKAVFSKLTKYLEDNPDIADEKKTDTVREYLKTNCNSNEAKFMGVGTNSICYRINDWGVRFLRPDAKNYGNDITYEKEAFMLKKVKETAIPDAQELIDVIKDKDKYYIITNLAKGKPLNAHEGRMLTEAQSKDVIAKLTALEKNGFIQYDAQLENIFFDKDKANLIDFGGCSVAIQDKKTLNKLKKENIPIFEFYPAFDNLRQGDIKRYNLDNELKTTKPYLGFLYQNTSHITRNSNPYFGNFSNISNFEYRSLFYHLFDCQKTNRDSDMSKNILVNYLYQKGGNYHQTMADFFENLNVKETAQACELDEKEIQNRINCALNYEKNLASILSTKDIPEEVLKTELAKMQMRWVIFNKNESSNIQFNNLTSMIKNFKENDNGQLKQYYDDSLLFFDKLKANINPENNKELDKSYDLVKLLFKQPKKDMTQSTGISKKTNKHLGLILGAIAAIFSIAAFLALKNKKRNNIIKNKNIPIKQDNINDFINKSKKMGN